MMPKLKCVRCSYPFPIACLVAVIESYYFLIMLIRMAKAIIMATSDLLRSCYNLDAVYKFSCFPATSVV